MNLWLDRTQISIGGSLGVSDDLINFREESTRNMMADSSPEKLWAQ